MDFRRAEVIPDCCGQLRGKAAVNPLQARCHKACRGLFDFPPIAVYSNNHGIQARRMPENRQALTVDDPKNAFWPEMTNFCQG